MSAVVRMIIVLSVAILATSASAPNGRQLVECLVESPFGKCEKCPPNAYMEAGWCYLQDIPGCLEYYPDQNRCKTFIKEARATRSLVTEAERKCPNLEYWTGSGCKPIGTKDCLINDIDGNQCHICIEGFYINVNSCKEGTLSNCKVYQRTVELCDICNDGYDQYKGSCYLHKDFCLEYATGGACQKCQSKKWVVNGNCFDITVANCDASGGVEDKCTTCALNHFLTLDGKCEKSNVANCGTHKTNENYCAVCNGGFKEFNGICRKDVAFCVSWLADGSACTGCDATYELFEQQCVTKVEGCLKYVDNLCTQCVTGKRVFNKKCEVDWNIKCVDYNKDTNVCNNCDSGFQKTLDGCKQANSDCEIPTLDGKCQVCNRGFYVDEAGVCQTQKIDFCADHVLNKNECKTCQANYYLTGGKCEPGTIQGCRTYFTNLNTCKECDLSKYVQASETSCVLSVAYCDQHDSTTNPTACIKCKPRFYLLDPTTCAKIADYNVCTSSGGIQNVCTDCMDGYYIPDGETRCAEQNIAGCNKYTPDTNVCIDCEAEEEIVFGNACVVDKSDYCLQYEKTTNTCNECDPRYYKVNGVCKASPDTRCLDYDGSTGKCTTCESGAYPDINGKCQTQKQLNCLTHVQNKNECEVCADKYLPDANGVCQLTVVYCDKYDDTTKPTECIKCLSGYYLAEPITCAKIADYSLCAESGGEEDVCKTCIDGYYPEYVTAELTYRCKDPNIADCAKYTSNTNTCVDCKTDKNIVFNNKCVLDKSVNCLQYEKTTNTCSKCESRYYDPVGGCKASPDTRCLDYDGSTGKCTTCESGAYPDINGKCQTQKQLNCLTHVQNKNECEVCADKYLPDANGVCQLTVVYCDKYDDTTKPTECIKCLSGYYLAEPITCAKIADYSLCAESGGEEDVCKTCIDGYYPEYVTAELTYRCKDPNIADCAKYTSNTNTCVDCKTDKNIVFNNKCVLDKSVNCLQYEKTTNTCSKCESRYYDPVGGCKASPDTRCLDYDGSTGKCTTCESGAYPDINGKCQTQKQLNCLTHVQNKNECEVCADKYLPDANGVCQLTVVYCDKYDDTTKPTECIKCLSGYYLAEPITCAKIADYSLCAESGGEEDVCKTCIDGYYPEYVTAELTYRCKDPNIADCAKYTSNTNTCVDCKTDKNIVFNNKCVLDKSVNCLQYEKTTNTCSKCESRYYDPVGGCKASPDTRCLDYDGSTGKCTTCESGAYPDINGKCQTQKQLNCLTHVQNKNECEVCADKYLPDANGVCQLTVVYCDKYDDTTKPTECIKCLSGYYLAEPITCAKIADYSLCAESGGEEDVCKTCIDGYYPEYVTAELTYRCKDPNIADCAKYTSNTNTCVDCKTDKNIVFNNKCVLDKSVNCLQYEKTTNTCSKCESRYYDPVGGCKASPDTRCLDYDGSTGKCTTCESGAYPDINGKCQTQKQLNCLTHVQNKNECEVCADKYLPDANGVCQLTVVYCDKYDDTTKPTECIKCLSGYYLAEPITCAKIADYSLCAESGGEEDVCKTCIDGYYPEYVTAELTYRCKDPNIADCAKYTSNTNTCVDCKTDKNIVFNNKCVLDKSVNCLQYEKTTNTCSKCESRYYDPVGGCKASPDTRCLDYDGSTGKCTTCESGAYPDINGKCQTQKQLNCLTHVQNKNECEVCADKYLPDANGVCQLTVVYCDKYDDTTKPTECIKCLSGYYLAEPITCAKIADYSLCAESGGEEDVCKTCIDGYYPEYVTAELTYRCKDPNIADCAKYTSNTNTCVDCKTDKNIVFNNKCVLDKSVNCLQYEKTTNTCSKCESRYYDPVGGCKASPDTRCLDYDGSTGKCTTCESGAYPDINGKCQTQKQLNCLTHVQNKNECEVCADKYLPDANGVCQLTVVYCDKYDDTTKPTECIKCLSGYYLAEPITCAKIADYSLCAESGGEEDVCKTCIDGYYPEYVTAELTYRCKDPNIADCAKYTSNTNTCVDCKTDKNIVFNNKCVLDKSVNCLQYEKTTNTCSKCESRYYDPVGGCKASPDTRCLDYDGSTGKCTTCESGAYPDINGKCQTQKQLNCLTHVQNKNECEVCADKYLPDANGVCQLTVVYCDKYDDTTKPTECIKCLSGYYLAEPITCAKIADYSLCAESGGEEDVCKTCIDGYYPEYVTAELTYRCKDPNIADCAKYTSNTNTCVDCKTDKNIVFNNKCVLDKSVNCLQYEKTTNTCSKCESRYYDPVGGCKASPDTRCLDYDGSTGKCTTCESGAYPDINGKCQTQKQLNCLTHVQNKNECEVCADKYLPDANGVCQLTVVYCDKYDDTTKPTECIKCLSGYYLAEPITCAKIADYSLCAESGGEEDVCKTCIDGYYPEYVTAELTYRCKDPNIADCAKYTSNTNTCVDCKTDKNIVFNNKCVLDKSVNCLQYEKTTNTCSKCESRYYDPVGGCKASPDTRCLDYDGSTGKCTTCESGAYPDINGKCQTQKQLNCLTHVQNKNECEVCADKYLPDANGVCQLTVVYCDKYDDTTKPTECIKCLSGYYLAEPITCAKIADYSLCAESGGEEDVCKTCIDGYYPEYVTAELTYRCKDPNIADCAKYTSNTNTCVDCKTDKNIVFNNKCVLDKSVNCLQYEKTTNTCSKCESRYYDPVGGCKASPDTRCLDYDGSTGKCTTCESGAYPDINGKCQTQKQLNCLTHVQNKNECEVCADKYLPDANGVCQLTVVYCDKYDDTTKPTECIKCLSGYYLAEPITCAKIADYSLCAESGGEEDVCKTCIDGYYPEYVTAELTYRCKDPNIADCAKYTSNTNTCVDCKTDKNIVFNNKCVLDKSVNCLQYEKTTNTCSKCESRYYDPVGGCKASPDTRCLDYDGSTGKCTTCESGAYPDINGKCQTQKQLNCLTHVQNKNECEVCADKYLPDANGVCQLTVVYCDKYDDTTKPTECIKCLSGYYLAEPITCARISDYFVCKLSAGLYNVCSTCIDTYYLDDSVSPAKCLPQNVAGCAKYTPSVNSCLFCTSSDQIVIQNQCVTDASIGCAQYDTPTNICSKCKPGYYDPAADAVVVCKPNPFSKCLVYDEATNKCATCEEGFFPHDPEGCKQQSQDHCESFEFNTNKCSWCLEGFYPLNDGSCTEQKLTGCSLFFSNSNKCLYCDEPTYERLNDFTCSLALLHCVQYETDIPTQCAKCDSMFYLDDKFACVGVTAKNCESTLGVDDVCDKCSSTSYPSTDSAGKKVCLPQFVPNCLAYKPYTNECTEMGSPYIPYQGVCVPPVDFCSEYSLKTLLCSACSENYILTDSKTCLNAVSGCTQYDDLVKTKCKVCGPLSYPTDDGRKCSPISDNNCEHSEGTDDECSECKPEWTFEEGKPGKRVCGKFKVVGCRFYNPVTDSCSVCHNRYTPVQSRCAEKQRGCLEYSLETLKCKKCDSTTVSIQGKCIKKLEDCVVHSQVEDECVLCQENRYPNPGQGCAMQSLYNCVSYRRNQNYCLKCKSGREPVDGNCPK
jgi:hypothetical protein